MTLAPGRTHTPIRSPRGAGLVHAIRLSGDDVTVLVCGRKVSSWIVAADEPVTCRLCLSRLVNG